MTSLILVAGGSASGKTTIARLVAERFTGMEVLVLSHDDYYRDVHHLGARELETYNFDHPEAIDHALLVRNMRLLLEGGEVRPPVYDFVTHRQTVSPTPLKAADIVVLEGIFTLYYQDLVPLASLKLFVDTDADLRLIRRLERDTRERGLTQEQVIRQYLSFVKPMHDAFIEPTKRVADLVIPGDRRFDNALRLLDGFFLNEMVDRLTAARRS